MSYGVKWQLFESYLVFYMFSNSYFDRYGFTALTMQTPKPTLQLPLFVDSLFPTFW